MKPLLALLWLALVSTALQAQSLTCSIELFRVAGKIQAGPPDLAGLRPYAVQTFNVRVDQPQSVKSVINGTTINSGVTVKTGKEQDEYLAVLDLEMIERGEVPPPVETKAAVKTSLMVKLNQPMRAGYSSEGNDLVKVWRVTLTP